MSNRYEQRVDENQYISIRLRQRAAGGCEAAEVGMWNTFRSGLAETFLGLGEDG